jgi:hypothetical protein
VNADKDQRGYVGGHFAFELQRSHAGWLFSAEGGMAKADIVTEKLGPDHIARKHIAGIKYEPITVTFGSGMSKHVYEWIADSFAHRYSRQSGAVLALTFDMKLKSRVDFDNALISEVGLPALDAASKDPCKVTLKLDPERTRVEFLPKHRDPGAHGTIDPAVQKLWLPSNFRLRVDGLDQATSRTNKVDAIVLKQVNTENAVGERRDYEREPARLEIPNVSFTTAESHADAIYSWYQAFVIEGQNGDDQEKHGALEYLTSDFSKVLCVVTFKHLGIFSVTPEKVESGSEQIRRVKVEMYCEDMTFEYRSSFV